VLHLLYEFARSNLSLNPDAPSAGTRSNILTWFVKPHRPRGGNVHARPHMFRRDGTGVPLSYLELVSPH
jgi:hypothetical protein